MKKLSVLTLILTLSVIFIASDISATGLSLTGVGGRATVFGGAFRGVANDWSAAYWNPAGLVQIQRFQFGGSVEYINPSVSFGPAKLFGANLTDGQNLGTAFTGDVTGEDLSFVVPAAGIVFRSGKMAIGLSVFAPFGLGAEWDVYDTKNYNSNYPDLDYDGNLQVIDIHPTFAYQVSDKISVGFGVSIMHSDIKIQMPRMTPSPLANFIPFGVPEAYNHVMTDIKLEGSGWGYGGNIGLMCKATENLQIGVSARYYLEQEVKGSFVAETYFANNPVGNATTKAVLDGALAAGQIVEAEYLSLLPLISGVKFTTANDQNATAKLPLPMNLGIGFAYTGIENWLLTCDVDFTKWSTFDEIEITLASGTETLTENWDNVIRLAFGFEHSMDKLKLRGGFYTENAAAVDETFSPSIPDVGRRTVIIGGLGYNFGNLDFHFVGEYFFVGDRTVNNWELNESKTGFDNFAGNYSASTITLMAGFEYNF